MDINTIGTLIGTLGFPIVCCLALGWFVYKAFEKFTTQSQDREDKLYKVIAQAQSTNEKLTETNAEFVKVLDTYKMDLNEIKDDISEIKERLN